MAKIADDVMQAVDGSTRRRKGLSIAAVSGMLEIPVPTIRSWERRYGFPVPARTKGKHRRYSPEEIEQLRRLRDTITQGYAAGEAVAIARNAPAGHPPRRPHVDALLKAAMGLDPAIARSVLHEATEAFDVERAIAEVALPAMQEVGSRWKAGACDAANEHLMTDTVRMWLARHATLAPLPSRPRPIVLACGPKELHSVGLEAFGVVLTRRGWHVVMLGALTPVSSLSEAVQETHAAAAVVVAQRAVNRRSTMESINAIHPRLGRAAFFAGAAFATPSARRDVAGTYLGTDLLEAALTVDATISGQPHTSLTGAG